MMNRKSVPETENGAVMSRTQSSPTRERILLIAAEQFAARGYHGASMRDIATAVGMRAPSLYSHFAGKEQLLLEIGRRYFDQMLPALQAAAAEPADPITRLHHLIAAASDIGQRQRSAHLTLVSEVRMFGDSPALAPLVDAGHACVQVWHRVITEGQESGDLRSDVSPAAATWLIFTAITGLVDPGHRADALGDPSSRTVDALTKVLIDGLRSPTGAAK